MMIVVPSSRSQDNDRTTETSSISKSSIIKKKKKKKDSNSNSNSNSNMTAKATISEEAPVSPSRWTNTHKLWCQEGATIVSPSAQVDDDENDVHDDSSSASSGPLVPQQKGKQQPKQQQNKTLVDAQQLKRQQSGYSADADNSDIRPSSDSSSSKDSSNSVVFTASNDECDVFNHKNNVRFAVTIHKQDTMSLDDYTKEEFQNCWYSPEEKRKKMKQREKIVARMEAGKSPKNHSMTYRGFEAWTQDGSDRLEQQIARCIDAVMDEQDAQWQKNSDDCEKMAACSRQISIQSTEIAIERAAVDELEAMEAHQMVDGDSDVEGDENSVYTAQSVQPHKRRAGRRPKQPRRRHRNDPQSCASSEEAQEQLREITLQPPGSLATDISKTYSNQLLSEMQNATKLRRLSDDELFGLTPTNSGGDSSISSRKSTVNDIDEEDSGFLETDISNHGMKKTDRWASIGSRNIAQGDDQGKDNNSKDSSSRPRQRIWSVRTNIIDSFKRSPSDHQEGPSSTKSSITESGHTWPLSGLSTSAHSDMLSPKSFNGSVSTRPLSSSLSSSHNDILLSPKRVESIRSIQVEENGIVSSPSSKVKSPRKRSTGKSPKAKRRSVSLSSPLAGSSSKKKDSSKQRSLSDAIISAEAAQDKQGKPVVKKNKGAGKSPKSKPKRRSSLGATEVPPPPPPPLRSPTPVRSPKSKKSKRRSSLGAVEAPPPPSPPSSTSPKGKTKRRSSISSVEVWSKQTGNEGSYDLKDDIGTTSKSPKKKPSRKSSNGATQVGSQRWADKHEIESSNSLRDKSPNRVTRSPSNTMGKKPYQPTTAAKDQEGSTRSRSKDRKSSKRDVADAKTASKESKKKESSSSHTRRSRSSSPGKKSKKKRSSSSEKGGKKSSSKSRSRSLSAGKYSNRDAVKNRKNRTTKDARPRSASPKRRADQANDMLNPNSLRSCRTTNDSTLRIVGSNIMEATPEDTKKHEPTLEETKKRLQEGLPVIPFTSPKYKGESSPKCKGGKKSLMGKLRGILDSPTPGFPKKYGASSAAKLPRHSDATETTDESNETNSPPKDQKKQRGASLFGGFRNPLGP